MRAAIEEAGIGDDFAGVRVAVQGAGHVGGDVVRHLLEAGARVTVADIYADRIEQLVALGAEAGDPRTVHSLECDVYSPCALGAVIRPETVAGHLRRMGNTAADRARPVIAKFVGRSRLMMTCPVSFGNLPK
jgi:glutamate dehydrogenase/leucine dehydrogenase